MSEVGKIFDSILDYKLRQEYNELQLIHEQTQQFLEKVRENQGIYDFKVCFDETNEYLPTPIAPIETTVPIKFITLKSFITREGATFGELIEDNDAKVAEGAITMEFHEDNSLSVLKALEMWKEFCSDKIDVD